MATVTTAKNHVDIFFRKERSQFRKELSQARNFNYFPCDVSCWYRSVFKRIKLE